MAGFSATAEYTEPGKPSLSRTLAAVLQTGTLQTGLLDSNKGLQKLKPNKFK